ARSVAAVCRLNASGATSGAESSTAAAMRSRCTSWAKAETFAETVVNSPTRAASVARVPASNSRNAARTRIAPIGTIRINASLDRIRAFAGLGSRNLRCSGLLVAGMHHLRGLHVVVGIASPLPARPTRSVFAVADRARDSRDSITPERMRKAQQAANSEACRITD